MKLQIFLVILFIFASVPAYSQNAEMNLINIEKGQLPLWYDGKKFTREGGRALEILKTADSHGIDPSRYEIGYIENIARQNSADPLEIKKANEKITQSLVLYMLDLKLGVEGSTKKLKNLDDKQRAEYQDYFAKALNMLVREKNYSKSLESFMSASPQYDKLKETLAFYNVLEKNKVIAPVTIAKEVKPGGHDAAVAQVRYNLALIKTMSRGEYEYPGMTNKSDVYDEDLQNDIKLFQRLNGMEETGKLDKELARKISAYLPDSISKIRLTMDKLRTNGDNFGEGKHLVINIPEFKLYAMDKGKLQFTMPVIVGRQTTATPEFQNKINVVVINPDWSPPHKIAKNELLPKIRKDPNFLTRGGYEVKWSDGEVISSNDYDYVDWDNVTMSDIRIRQTSGAGNALGHVKFLMPDNDNIYLHDTNSRKLFANSFRALSHGCIRLGDPLKLAEFVLGEGFGEDAMKKKIARGSMQSVKVDGLPVYAVYKTAWIDNEGVLHTVSDVYSKESSFSKRIAESGLKSGLVASVSPAYPASYWAGVNMNEIALSVNPNTP